MGHFQNINDYSLDNDPLEKIKKRKKVKGIGIKPKEIDQSYGIDFKAGEIDPGELGGTVTPPKKVKGKGIMSKAEDIMGTAKSLISNNMAKFDTSGNTDVSSMTNDDVTRGAIGTATDTLDMASKGMQIGGPWGAAAGAVVGLGKNLIQGDDKKRQLKLAKKRYFSKQRYKSEQKINDISNKNRENDIIGEDNRTYIENLRNSPSYNRFKRNSQY